MCLERVFTDEEMDKRLEDQPEIIEIGKSVKILEASYIPSTWSGSIYVGGLNQAKQEKIDLPNDEQYWSGFHYFLNYQQVENYVRMFAFLNELLVKCLIKKEWITAVGISGYWLRDSSGEINKSLCVVTSQAIFPHFPETEARYEDLPKEEIAENRPKTVAAPFPPLRE